MPESNEAPANESAAPATTPIDSGDELASFSLEPGTLVGRYQIVAKLATGGMGVLFRAYDPELSRYVALKLVQQGATDFDRLGSGEKYEQRLLREAQALARLSHPNVVAAFDVGRFEGALFIAMELIDGVSLRSWLQSARRSRAEILRLLLEAGRGLSAAHRAGVVHRDFKLANVMVWAEGRVQVVDFGLARTNGRGTHGEPNEQPKNGPRNLAPVSERLLSEGSSAELTRTGAILGTAGYIAPEQLHAGTSDERSDQFSYACSAFRALTGEAPYPGDSLPDYVSALSAGKRAAWPNSVPRAIRNVIDRGLSLLPEDRYPNLDALLDDLERAARPARWVALLVGAALLLSLLASAVAVRERLGDRCDVDLLALDRTWSVERQASVSLAFERSGNPRAADTIAMVAARLADYRLRWPAAKQDACLAARVRHEQSEQILSLRNGCLDGKLAQLDTLLTLFEKADAALVDRATGALDAVAQLRDCSDVGALVGESERLPDDPQRRGQVQELQTRLDQIQAIVATGRWSEALELAQTLALDAERVEHQPIRARAMSQALLALERLGRQEEAKALRQRTLELAAEARTDDVLAMLAMRLLLLSLDGERFGEAKAMLPLVEASVRQAGQPPALQIRLSTYQAAILSADGDFPAAIAKLEQALGECRRLGNEGLGYCLTPQRELGLVYWAQKNASGARRALEAAVDIARQAYGPRHPNLLNEYNNLSYCMARLGDVESASRALAESKALAATLPQNRQSANIPQVEALILQARGDALAALPFLEQAIRRLTATYGEDSAHVSETWYIWGTCLMDLGKHPEAAARFERALEIRRRTRARASLIAEAAFGLAQASWNVPSQRRRARELAEQALELYREGGPVSAAETREVAAWLADHPLPTAR